MVLDVDNHGGLTTGFDSLAALGPLPVTPLATTPNDGLHFWFRGDGPCRMVAPGIDLKGRGGYVLAPPSRTASGMYDWQVSIDEARLASLPELPSVRPQVTTPKHDKRSQVAIPDLGGPIHEGQRHESMVALAVQLRYQGAGLEGILDGIRSMNEERCTPPKGDEEIVSIAQWAAECPAVSTDGFSSSRAALEAMWEQPRSPGKAGVTDWRIMQAILERARKARRFHGLHLPVRSFPGIGTRTTVSTSLRRLLKAGHLARSSRKSRWLAQAFDLVLPKLPASNIAAVDAIGQVPMRSGPGLRSGLAQVAFGGRENARRILVALEEDSSRTSTELAGQLGLKADTVRRNLGWLKDRELDPESGLDAILRLGLEQGTLDAWIERSLRVDRERHAADLYVRQRAGVDRLTGELL
jgi:hypothetical protein